MTELDPVRAAPVDVYRIINARVNEAGDLPRDSITSVCKEIAAILGARAMQAAGAGVRVKALAEFARERIREAWEGCDGGDEIQDHAKKLGLIIEEPGGYDPEKHGNSCEAEPGERWFVFADWLDEAPALSPAGPQEVVAARHDAVAKEWLADPAIKAAVHGATPAPAADVAGLVERIENQRRTVSENLNMVGATARAFAEALLGTMQEAASTIEALQAKLERKRALISALDDDRKDKDARATAAEAEAAALRAEVERMREAQGGFLIGDPVTIGGAYEQEWHGWSGYLCGVVMEANGKINVTVSGSYPPKHLGEMTDGFSFCDLRSALGKGESPDDTKAGE